MEEDFQLLDAYVRNGSEEAFCKLVERHSAMVYGVARRMVGEDMAEEVAQGAFLLLARKAKSINSRVVLAGWLHRATRFIALEILRRETRKRELTEKLSRMEELNCGDESIWTQLAPLLDDALEALRGADREAIVLRFLEGRSFSEVATATHSTEAAAKMRVSRALEELRGVFARQGVVLSSAGLATALSTHGAVNAPAGLATAVLAKSSQFSAPTLADVLKNLLFMKKIKIAVVALGALLLTGSIVTPIALQSKAVVTTFHPMDGEWSGNMELTIGGQKTMRPVELLVTTSPDGRRCEIDMRVAESDFVQKFHFTHELDSTGRQIATKDDPRINLLQGFGKVTGAAQSGKEWRAEVRTSHPNGFTNCRWVVQGDALIIARHDRLGSIFRKVDQYSTLELRRKTKVASSL
jgi:RNA polymerase sigma factor (sigma-70 family)